MWEYNTKDLADILTLQAVATQRSQAVVVNYVCILLLPVDSSVRLSAITSEDQKTMSWPEKDLLLNHRQGLKVQDLRGVQKPRKHFAE